MAKKENRSEVTMRCSVCGLSLIHISFKKQGTYQHQLPHLFKLFTKLVNLATFIITNIHTNFFKIKM